MLLGIILAGGQSRRMGKDKAMLDWQGDTLLAHAQQLLIEAGCDSVVVSRNAPHYIRDVFAGMGPLAGIHACLTAYTCDEAIVIPVDMPLLSSTSLINLIHQGQQLNNSCFYASSVLPCYLRVTPPLIDECRQRLEQQRLSLQSLLRGICAAEIDFDGMSEMQELMNTNTPEQWAEANNLVNERELA